MIVSKVIGCIPKLYINVLSMPQVLFNAEDYQELPSFEKEAKDFKIKKGITKA